MKNIPDDIVYFLEKQGFAIVSTLDENNSIHCSAKGVAGVEPEGKIYLIDIYRARTFKNLKRDKTVTITAVDEHRFIGYTLKGKASIVEKNDINASIINDWESRVVERISKRVLHGIKESKKSSHHPEALFPHPQYLIEMEVEEIVDLTPGHLKKKPAK